MKADEVKINEIKELGQSIGKNLFGELVEMYKTETPQILEEMNSSLQANNFEQIGKLAHKLKSSNASFGFGEIESLCAQMEKQWQEWDASTFSSQIKGLEKMCYDAQITLEGMT